MKSCFGRSTAELMVNYWTKVWRKEVSSTNNYFNEILLECTHGTDSIYVGNAGIKFNIGRYGFPLM